MEENYGYSENVDCKHKTYNWRITAEAAAAQLGVDKSKLCGGRKKVPALGNQVCDVWICGKDCILADGRGKYPLYK